MASTEVEHIERNNVKMNMMRKANAKGKPKANPKGEEKPKANATGKAKPPKAEGEDGQQKTEDGERTGVRSTPRFAKLTAKRTSTVLFSLL